MTVEIAKYYLTNDFFSSGAPQFSGVRFVIRNSRKQPNELQNYPVRSNRKQKKMKVLFLLLVNAASVYSNVAHPDIQLLDEVVHWTRASGGYVSDKMEIKHIHGDLSGLFAKENIQKDEVIVDIPWNLVSRPDKGEEAEWCDTVEYVRAMITKDPSLQTPYEKYLAQRKNHHPYFWTRQGKELLNYLIKDCFPMRRFQFDYEESWNYDCPHAMEQSHRDAMMLLQTRGEGPNGFDFVPIHDLLNHRVCEKCVC